MTEKSWEVVACLDRIGIIKFTTESCKQIIGYEPREVVGRIGFDFVHPEDRVRVMKLFAKLTMNKALTVARFRLVAKDGTTKWVQCTGRNLLEDPAVGALVIYYHDISAQVHVEDALKASESQFRVLADAIPQLAWMADPSGFISWYNKRWYEFTGTTYDEMMTKGWQTICHPDHLSRIESAIKKSFARAEPFEDTFPMRAKNGEWKWFLTRAVPVKENGIVVRWVGTNTDVTERLEAEAQLEESRDRLTLALRAANMGTFDWDLLTGENVLSTRTQELYGFKKGEFKGTIEEIRERVLFEDRNKVKTAFEDAVKRRDTYYAEARIGSGNGEVRWVAIYGKPYFSREGKPIRVVGLVADLTEQKKAREDLLHAKALAESASQAKSQFLANMSHEIRTPLGAILGFTELIRDRALNKRTRLEYADIVHRNGLQLASVLNDILDLSKVEAGKLEIEQLVFSLPRLVSDTIKFLQPLARKKEIRLTVADHRKDFPKKICSDPARVRQVLMNVIGNAIKFTPSHGSIDVQLLCNAEEQKAYIDIQDSGVGMTEQQRMGVFGAFFQADSSMTRRHGGTGLGLTISKNLARLLKGDLEILSSEVGKGTTFRFTIPVTAPEMCSAEQQLREHKPGGRRGPSLKHSLRGARVLLAEDSADNRLLIRQYLKTQGVQLDFAENGQEAVEKALGKDFDVILMDIQMPVMDGYHATHALRESGYNGPIVALTAHALKEEREHSLEAGCDEHLTKPIDKEQLIETIAKYLSSI